MFTVPLLQVSNLIAVNATNDGGPASLIVAMLIEYTDGTADLINTDSSWKTLTSVPPSSWQLPSTDDSSWISATTEGLEGVGPWGITGVPS